MNKFLLWTFPLIVVTVYLLATVSKPDMPQHFSLPEPPQRNAANLGETPYTLPFYN
jgi:hypothetical protein